MVHLQMLRMAAGCEDSRDLLHACCALSGADSTTGQSSVASAPRSCPAVLKKRSCLWGDNEGMGAERGGRHLHA